MRRYLIIILLAMVAPCKVMSQSVENRTTRHGEWAHYEVYYNWGFIWINAAEVVFSTNKVSYNGHDAFKLRCTGRTYDSYDWFFCVRDTFESVVHPQTLTPYTFHQHNSEGKRRTINDYTYYQADTTIRIKGELWKNSKSLELRYDNKIKWRDNAADVLNMVYKARNIDYSRYKVGEQIPITMIINHEIFNLYIRYLGKETITTKEGRSFKCLKIKPLLVDGTIFSGGEDMTVWVTDDKSRVPVVIEAKVIVGSVKAMFVKGAGFTDNMEAEVKK